MTCDMKILLFWVYYQPSMQSHFLNINILKMITKVLWLTALITKMIVSGLSSASLPCVSIDFQTKPTPAGIILSSFPRNKESPVPQTHLFHIRIYKRSFRAVGVQIKSVGWGCFKVQSITKEKKRVNWESFI